LKIIRENVEIPKTERELELERKEAIQKEKNEINLSLTEIKSLEEVQLEKESEIKRERQLKYLNKFKKKYKIVSDIELDDLLALPNAIDAFDEFLDEIEIEEDGEATESDEVEDDD